MIIATRSQSTTPSPQVSSVGLRDAARDQAWGLGEHRNEELPTNLSPMDSLQRQRVEKARMMLADRHQSIIEIALDCGITSGVYFSSVFRRHFHCSPRACRNALPEKPGTPLR